VLLTGVFAASAKADTLYSYIGDTFTFVQGAVYAKGDQVTGNFVLSASFIPDPNGGYLQTITSGVTSYSFTDGHQTFTQANSTGIFQVGLNPNYLPDAINNWWYVDLHSLTGEITTAGENHGEYLTFAALGSSYASIQSFDGFTYPGGPGTWTLQTPEGGSTALFLLAGLTILSPFIGLKRVTRGR
jgi:hypothetical protein